MRKLRTSGKSGEKKERAAFGKNLVFNEFQVLKIHTNPRLRPSAPSLPKNKYPQSLRQTVMSQSKQNWFRQETPSIEQGSTNCETNNQTKSITQHKYHLNSVDFTPNDTVHSTVPEPAVSKNLPKFKSTVPMLRRQGSTLSIKDKQTRFHLHRIQERNEKQMVPVPNINEPFFAK